MRRMATDSMTVKLNPNDKGNPVGKLADAELRFTGGPLAGLKLIGFGIWERRGTAARNVTFPARQYSVKGEKRTFTLLRPIERGVVVSERTIQRVHHPFGQMLLERGERRAVADRRGEERAAALATVRVTEHRDQEKDADTRAGDGDPFLTE